MKITIKMMFIQTFILYLAYVGEVDMKDEKEISIISNIKRNSGSVKKKADRSYWWYFVISSIKKWRLSKWLF